MSKRRKLPAPGDTVEIRPSYPKEREDFMEANVEWVGSTQFSCVAEDGHRYMVPRNGSIEWRKR